MGFEPMTLSGTSVFKTDAFNHSATRFGPGWIRTNIFYLSNKYSEPLNYGLPLEMMGLEPIPFNKDQILNLTRLPISATSMGEVGFEPTYT